MELVWCSLPSQQGYQFALKQTAAFYSESNCTERRPGRINVMMRALDGDREDDFRVRDKLLQFAIVFSEFISVTMSRVRCVGDLFIWILLLLLNIKHDTYQWKIYINVQETSVWRNRELNPHHRPTLPVCLSVIFDKDFYQVSVYISVLWTGCASVKVTCGG